MNRREARRRLDAILSEGEPAAGALRALLRDCEQAAAAGSAEPGWRVQAAEVFVDLLCPAAMATLPQSSSPESAERLDQALLQGPAGLEALRSELAGRVRDCERPLAELEILRARHRCQQLRLRCLDHLDALFGAERAQP